MRPRVGDYGDRQQLRAVGSFTRGFPGRRGIDTPARSDRDFSLSLSLSLSLSSAHLVEDSARPISNGASNDTLTWMTGIYALKGYERGDLLAGLAGRCELVRF